MGGHPLEPRLLPRCLEGDLELELAQVPKAAVDELRGFARGAGGEVVPFDEAGPESAGRRVERDPAPRDPSADDEKVEGLAAEAREGRVAIHLLMIGGGTKETV